MKTTLDLPNDLLFALKLRAEKDGRKYKEVVAETLRRGLSLSAPPATGKERHRVKLPIVVAPPGVAKFELTGERIHELEMETELKSFEASLRR